MIILLQYDIYTVVNTSALKVINGKKIKNLLWLSVIVTISLVSCGNEEHPEIRDDLSITGTWNVDFRRLYNLEGEVTFEESLDTTRLIVRSIDDLVIQEMLIDTTRSIFYLLYASYDLEKESLIIYPDSLIDINLNKYYPVNGGFLTPPYIIISTPSESTLEQLNRSQLIENRIFNTSSLDLFYSRTNETGIDLMIEFEFYRSQLRSSGVPLDSHPRQDFSY